MVEPCVMVVLRTTHFYKEGFFVFGCHFRSDTKFLKFIQDNKSILNYLVSFGQADAGLEFIHSLVILSEKKKKEQIRGQEESLGLLLYLKAGLVLYQKKNKKNKK